VHTVIIISLNCIYAASYHVGGQPEVHIANVVKKQIREEIHTQNEHQLRHQQYHFATNTSNSAKS
jgi:hypothetical protein